MICAKVPYATRFAAVGALAHLRSRRGRHESSVYRCRTCGAWHLTSRRA